MTYIAFITALEGAAADKGGVLKAMKIEDLVRCLKTSRAFVEAVEIEIADRIDDQAAQIEELKDLIGME